MVAVLEDLEVTEAESNRARKGPKVSPEAKLVETVPLPYSIYDLCASEAGDLSNVVSSW